MPPRRSTRKTASSIGKRNQQQTKITDRKLRTIKKHKDSQHESNKFVKPMDVSDNEDVVTNVKRQKQNSAKEIKPGIHQEQLSQTDILLRKFDLDYQYGPCVGLTRMERWNRAQKLGLHPPQEVKDVLDNSNNLCVFEL